MTTTGEYRTDFGARVSHIIQVMTQTQLADLVGASPSAVSRWASGDDTPSDERAELLLDVDYILGQFAQHYPAHRFHGWFDHGNAFLNGARPRDVLRVEGPTRVIEALHSEVAGSFA